MEAADERSKKMGTVLIAYDASPHSEDAVVLGRQLAEAFGLELALANVYRADPPLRWPSAVVPGRAEFLGRESLRLLEKARERFGLEGAELYPLAGTTTASALRGFAERRHPTLIVFGSAHDAAPARVHPGSAARRLLQGAPVPLAFAPACYQRDRARELKRIGYDHDDQAANAQARAAKVAALVGGEVVGGTEGADLLVLGSPGGHAGRLRLVAKPQVALQAAEVPCIVLPAGVQLFANAPQARAA